MKKKNNDDQEDSKRKFITTLKCLKHKKYHTNFQTQYAHEQFIKTLKENYKQTKIIEFFQ